jgi:hypothetical protein|nr:MAG TPA: Single strand binding protein [Caudoviricetes sp.]
MAKDLNQVTLMGRLTKHPELKTTKSGKNICSFTLAVNAFQEDKTNFIDCKAWTSTAELISKYVTKGQRLLVVGELEQESWEQDGQKRSKLCVVVREIQFIEKRNSNEAEIDKIIQEVDEPIDLSQIPF